MDAVTLQGEAVRVNRLAIKTRRDSRCLESGLPEQEAQDERSAAAMSHSTALLPGKRPNPFQDENDKVAFFNSLALPGHPYVDEKSDFRVDEVVFLKNIAKHLLSVVQWQVRINACQFLGWKNMFGLVALLVFGTGSNY